MVLVDSSVWIEYFKGNAAALPLNQLIDTNAVCTNDLILAELLPSIIHKKENKLKDLLLAITKTSLSIDWNRIIAMQTLNLRSGLNKIGISDLIITQNAIDTDIQLFTLDKHFSLMSGLHGLKLYIP
jgi:predicted nucleic acid-binding protein